MSDELRDLEERLHGSKEERNSFARFVQARGWPDFQEDPETKIDLFWYRGRVSTDRYFVNAYDDLLQRFGPAYVQSQQPASQSVAEKRGGIGYYFDRAIYFLTLGRRGRTPPLSTN